MVNYMQFNANYIQILDKRLLFNPKMIGYIANLIRKFVRASEYENI